MFLSLLRIVLFGSIVFCVQWNPAFCQEKISKKEARIVPLKSAGPQNLGPLNLPYLVDALVGSAFVYNGEQQDIFVLGRKTGATKLYLFRWLGTDSSGAPVFSKPVEIIKPAAGKGTVYQSPDGAIHGFWLVKDTVLVRTVFDKEKKIFRKTGEIKLPALPAAPQHIGVLANEDGSLDIVVEVKGFRRKGKYPNQHPATPEWRPYDEAGIASLPMQYNRLFSFRIPHLSSQQGSEAKQASTTTKEVYSSMQGITSFQYGNNKAVITGSRVGVFPYYPVSDTAPLKFSKRRYLVDEDSIVIRHPSVNPTVCAYRSKNGQYSGLLAAGEGAMYYYRFTGRFTRNGDPVFKKPLTVLQEEADLFLGTLPSMCIADWDGDGKLDLLAGNSEGFLMFSRNTGSNEKPAFLPGERVQAGGEVLQVQAGYTSIQGIPETRWGYTSPTVFDWNEDGLPDIIMGDITGDYSLYLNKGTINKPVLEARRPIYLDGIELHGMWRSSAAIAKIGNRIAMIIVDEEDELHLYWKRDNYNVEDGGKILLNNGQKIATSLEPGGGTGRVKLSLFDYDGDGHLDLIIGTGFRSAIPDKQHGFPQPSLGKHTMGTPLFMRNAGTGNKFIFEPPLPFIHRTQGLVQPGGIHETGAVATTMGGGPKPNLLVADESGRIFLLAGSDLTVMRPGEEGMYRETLKPFEGYPVGKE